MLRYQYQILSQMSRLAAVLQQLLQIHPIARPRPAVPVLLQAALAVPQHHRLQLEIDIMLNVIVSLLSIQVIMLILIIDIALRYLVLR